MTEQLIDANIAKVLGEVRDAAQKYGRNPADVTVMAVSKTRPAAAVRTAAASGMKNFGENYLQEALPKIADCRDLPLQWHFIGPIQSNKTRAIAEHFAWVHSVDREKILKRLNDHRSADIAPLNICLQVNISGEASKSGVSPDALPDLADFAATLPRLHLRGLMAVPAPSEGFTDQKAAADELAQLFAKIRSNHPQMDTLSLGMSADLEAAIAAGSTMLRIGTAIFGPRPTS